MDEALNLRSFYLRLFRKIWILPLAAAIGGLIAGLIYFVATVVYGPARSYSATATIYIDFAYDESGEVVDWYNAYTWNLLMATDEIIDTTMENLKDAGIPEITDASVVSGISSGVSREEVLESTSADIPSDVRVMVLTITNNDQELADAILEASAASLEHFGSVKDEFNSIKQIGSTPAELVVYTDRTLAAVIFGVVIGLLIAFFAMLLINTMDDAIYVPEDVQSKYGLTLLGCMTKSGVAMPDRFRNELIEASHEFLNGKSQILLISSGNWDDDTKSKEDSLRLHELIEGPFDFNKTSITGIEIPGNKTDSYRKINETDGVIIAIQAGKRIGTATDHLISQLKKHNCNIVGIILTDVDMKFLKLYYRMKK
ncbi:MAG: hypothetical protein IJV29_00785 [Butyrivibrio sp.]|nr:hypothetical protein [Butyrivibrio sp.]